MPRPTKLATPSFAARTRRGALRSSRGDATRTRILDAALRLFRKNGFELTNMRDVAKEAGVAVGAAYYYFPSKDAIVLAYYERTQAQCAVRVREALAATTDVRERLGAVYHARLDVLAKDRRILSGLFRSIADPTASLSIFGAEARAVREDSIRQFDDALATSPPAAALDPGARRVLVLALWSLHMGMILYFIHDRSPKAEKTRALVDRTLDLVCGVLPIAPDLAPIFGTQIAGILDGAGLLG
jgi:AcrR family transcriptional regulator